MKKPLYAVIGLAAAIVAGCASVPTGPTQMALPGTGKTFERFRSDDEECQHYAFERIGGKTAKDAAEESALRSAAIGTAIGAAAGAAIGGHGSAAGVGAGMGLIVGSMSGAGAGERSAHGTQRQYDNAYIQCMYARGHKVPVPAEMAHSLQQRPSAPVTDAYSPPPAIAAPKTIPEPPRGSPPPPPPGY